MIITFVAGILLLGRGYYGKIVPVHHPPYPSRRRGHDLGRYRQALPCRVVPGCRGSGMYVRL
jgi:hypothetical protein